MTMGTANQTLTLELGGPCAHVYDVSLGCEPHAYAHVRSLLMLAWSAARPACAPPCVVSPHPVRVIGVTPARRAGDELAATAGAGARDGRAGLVAAGARHQRHLAP